MNRSLCALALLLFGQPASASPLTLDEAVNRALANDAFDAALVAEHEAAVANAASAGRWANPQVQWSREQLATSDGSEDVIQLSQALDVSGRLGLSSDAAEHDARAVSLRHRQVRARRVAAARRAFYSVLFEQHRNDVLLQWRQHLAQLARAVRARSEAGDAAEYEAGRLEAQLSRVDANLVVASTKRGSAWTDLVILMGRSEEADPPWPRVEGTLLPKIAFEIEGSTAEAISNRGDVAALDAQRAAATARERAAGRWWVPRLSLQAGYKGVRDNTAEDHGVVMGVGVELPIFDRAQGQDDAQAAIGRRAAAQHDSLTWAATQRVREGRSAAVELVNAAKTLRDGAAVSADKLARTAQASYLAGELGIVELLDAHHNALESKLETLGLELRARITVIELERETGVTQ